MRLLCGLQVAPGRGAHGRRRRVRGAGDDRGEGARPVEPQRAPAARRPLLVVPGRRHERQALRRRPAAPPAHARQGETRSKQAIDESRRRSGS